MNIVYQFIRQMELKILRVNQLKVKLVILVRKKEYIYSAQRSGIYRFDFDIDDVNNDYVFKFTIRKIMNCYIKISLIRVEQ